MFGKKLAECLKFERWILILIAAAFSIRWALSSADIPINLPRWVSIHLVLLIGLIYFSVAVHVTGFGGYKHLLGLLLIQNVEAHFLIALAIAFAGFTGTDNIYTLSSGTAAGISDTSQRISLLRSLLR